MPFLHCRYKFIPLSTEWEKRTYKIGYRPLVVNVAGDRYNGEWKANKKDGKGILKTRSGKQYEGDWECAHKHGFGILSEKQENDVYRSMYVGDWCNGRKQGYGRYHYPAGGWYDGQWCRGMRWGIGESLFGDGSYYYGQWKNDKFHGYGYFVQANGNQYEGEWQNGNKHGYGKFYHVDSGQMQEGMWNNNFCLCSKMVDIYYRQSALEPSKYPIPQIKLKNPKGVYQEQADKILRKQKQN